MPEPLYEPEVSLTLDKIEHDPGRADLWNAICDAVDLVCDNPGDPKSRRQALRLPSGEHAWLTPIRCPSEPDNWAMIWRDLGDDAAILYIGPWPPSTSRGA